MVQQYTEYYFKISPKDPWEDILLAQLQLLSFESFLAVEDGLKAYIPSNLNSKKLLETIAVLKDSKVKIHYTQKEIAPENWNAKWESSFQPVYIGDNCVIRADFHREEGKPLELIINPKMSFGTGHHPTTLMMAEFALEEDFNGAKVLDMGCGTGILAILASKLGASLIEALDLDPWCIENTTENAQKNNCNNIQTEIASSLKSTHSKYQFIFANINRNTLLEQIPSYSKSLKEKGILLLSGFYKEEEELLVAKCKKANLALISRKKQESWVALKFKKY